MSKFQLVSTTFVDSRMPLKGIPLGITSELLYSLAKMGHGDLVVIADSNFPSDSTADCTVIKGPIRVAGSTTNILRDILTLMPLDSYSSSPVCVMDRVQSDKDRNLEVTAYKSISCVIGDEGFALTFVERFEFYALAKRAFCIVQSTDSTPYANVIISKGVL